MIQSISTDGIELLKRLEGLRLKAYQDSAGVWTIGFGHTEGVRPGDVITESKARQYLHWDLGLICYPAIRELGPIHQALFDGLCCLSFNIGGAAFRKSTLRRKLVEADGELRPEMKAAWLAWRYAGGKPILLRRRAIEWNWVNERLASDSSDEAPLVMDLPTLYEDTRSAASVLFHNRIRRLGYESVEAFQRSNMLVADGIVGPVTWRALVDSLEERRDCEA
jgi:lysozyme